MACLSTISPANLLPLVDYSSALTDYPGEISFIVGEKDPIISYVKQAHQSKAGSKIHIIPQKNHMSLFLMLICEATVTFETIRVTHNI